MASVSVGRAYPCRTSRPRSSRRVCAPNPNWSRSFSPQPEIQSYLQRVARRSGTLDRFVFDTAVEHAAWDEAQQEWVVRTTRGEVRARTIISAAGGLGYLLSGHLAPVLFLETLLGLMVGAWFGAKATHLAPLPLLKFCIVGMSAAGGIILLLFH